MDGGVAAPRVVPVVRPAAGARDRQRTWRSAVSLRRVQHDVLRPHADAAPARPAPLAPGPRILLPVAPDVGPPARSRSAGFLVKSASKTLRSAAREGSPRGRGQA